MATLDLIVPPAPPRIPVYLSELAWVSQSGTVYLDKQVITSFGPGGSSSTTYPITLGGTTYAKGLGTAAGSDVQYYLGGHCTTLSALAGVDDNALSFGTPSAEMRVIVDGVTVFDQTIAKGSPVTIDQNITSAKVIDLNVAAQTGFGPSTPADWANAHVTCA
jgi:alpha-galactosidase